VRLSACVATAGEAEKDPQGGESVFFRVLDFAIDPSMDSLPCMKVLRIPLSAFFLRKQTEFNL
jgi:hypothetical protein